MANCVDGCPNNPVLSAPQPLSLPPTLPSQTIADAVYVAVNQSTFPVVIAWDVPFPKPTGVLASVAAPLSRGPPLFHFNLAGALLTQICILHFSTCEYLLNINSPVQTSGFGGR